MKKKYIKVSISIAKFYNNCVLNESLGDNVFVDKNDDYAPVN